MVSPRQLAFLALRSIQQGAFADVAIERVFQQAKDLSERDRSFIMQLVYGTVRWQRTLDALIDQLASKPAAQQPPNLRLILQLGLYQLRYLNQVPPSAAVDTTVELAKQNGLTGLAGFVNGLLRQYLRLSQSAAIAVSSGASSELVDCEASHPQAAIDPLHLPTDAIERLAVQYSYPDWIVQVWVEQFGLAAAERLCAWLNQTPHIDLRINPLRATLEQVEAAMQAAGVAVQRIGALPQALRLPSGTGTIQNLPGFAAGWWTVQDASAQLVGALVDPQPGETVVDACAAPGGKTMHLAELMQDQGVIWAIDRHASRLKKVQANLDRLQLRSVQLRAEDSRLLSFPEGVDRVLLDVPCSGLGTLHRHADARWRQSPKKVQELAQLQSELLDRAATWVKPGGVLVYATCTLHPLENEAVVQRFLSKQGDWAIELPSIDRAAAAFVTPMGWLKVLPYEHNMDGFFMVRLRKT